MKLIQSTMLLPLMQLDLGTNQHPSGPQVKNRHLFGNNVKDLSQYSR